MRLRPVSSQASPRPRCSVPAPPPPEPAYRRECATVEDRVYFPDGTVQRGNVRACRDYSGRWHVVN